MDVLAVQFHVAGIPANMRLTLEDIAPPHLRSLVDRLAASQVDGVSLQQFFRPWGMWQAGKRRWVEPVAAFSSTKLGGTLLQVGRAGTSIRSMLGANCAGEPVIPELCTGSCSSMFGQFAPQAFVISAAIMAYQGPYAVQAGEDSLESSDNLQIVQRLRIRDYRERNQLQADSDFAYAFSTLEEASLTLGDFGAEAWARIRAEQDAQLMPAAVAGGGGGAGAPAFRALSLRPVAPVVRLFVFEHHPPKPNKWWLPWISWPMSLSRSEFTGRIT
eukprot:Skav211854  [mRNA]  locus=scaffold1622:149261:150225:- [translate_table: standard]